MSEGERINRHTVRCSAGVVRTVYGFNGPEDALEACGIHAPSALFTADEVECVLVPLSKLDLEKMIIIIDQGTGHNANLRRVISELLEEFFGE